jgi:hypothetical protein
MPRKLVLIAVTTDRPLETEKDVSVRIGRHGESPGRRGGKFGCILTFKKEGVKSVKELSKEEIDKLFPYEFKPSRAWEVAATADSLDPDYSVVRIPDLCVLRYTSDDAYVEEI